MLALLSGVLLAASFPRFGVPVFGWIALTPLIVGVILVSGRETTALAAARLGLITGIVYFLGTVYWVITVMHGYGGLSQPVAVLVGLLLAVYLALYPAVFAIWLRLAVRSHGAAGVWLAPLLWVASEWLRSTIGGGFPWVLLGTSQSSVLPIVQLASLTGVYGVSALVALVSTAAALLALSARAHRRGVIAVAAAMVVTSAWGAWRISDHRLTREGNAVRVGLVQGSVEQDDKYDPAHAIEIVNRYVGLSRQVIGAGADLVIWPEASTPFPLDLDSLRAAPIRRLAAETHTPFVIGTDEFERGGAAGQPDRYYNSAVLVGRDGRSLRSYRKQQLVPFGEYVPLKKLLFFVGPLIEAVSDFSAGTEAVVFDADGRRLSVAICYESVYPSIARAFVQGGSELLATITNDAWFGRSSAPYQHFEQGAMRAVEEGRYVVRAANTGISGAVDPYGRVLARTPLFQPDALTVDVRLLQSRTIYSRAGDWVAWIALAVSAWLMATAARVRSTRKGH